MNKIIVMKEWERRRFEKKALNLFSQLSKAQIKRACRDLDEMSRPDTQPTRMTERDWK